MLTYTDALFEALDRLDDLGAEIGEVGFVNHAPMAAEALAALGHSDQVTPWVRSFREARPFHEAPTVGHALDGADESSWRGALGNAGKIGDWEGLFRRELAEAPWRDVLTRWWPRLLPGLVTRLTHGMIRTAHAVRGLASTTSTSDAQLVELARALALWAAYFSTLPGTVALTGRASVADAIAALPRTPVDFGNQPPWASATTHRVQHPDELPGYRPALNALRPGEPQWLLTEMTTEFAGVYQAQAEVHPVPLVHAVTAPAAARLVLPHLPIELHIPTVAALWQAHVTMLVAFTTGRRGEDTAVATAIDSEPPPFDELVGRAVEHGDEHVIKFTEACLREHALRPDPRYPAAVHAAQQRIPRL